MDPVLEIEHITKTFGSVRAVDDLSFQVDQGEIFALLGPNGAGKTTTIRLALDIFRPDSGRIAILGGAMTEAKKDRIGYMPEERGLYQDIPLERVLVYLASLKNVPTGEAHRRAAALLERFDLAPYANKKVRQLSKGMQQKAQIIATILHRPELIIIDEPFGGLDPVNTRMIKSLLLELRRGGATLIMSTHQMHQVEELAAACSTAAWRKCAAPTPATLCWCAPLVSCLKFPGSSPSIPITASCASIWPPRSHLKTSCTS
jgi:ABC-2 type transport system ATP-binding protein